MDKNISFPEETKTNNLSHSSSSDKANKDESTLSILSSSPSNPFLSTLSTSDLLATSASFSSKPNSVLAVKKVSDNKSIILKLEKKDLNPSKRLHKPILPQSSTHVALLNKKSALSKHSQLMLKPKICSSEQLLSLSPKSSNFFLSNSDNLASSTFSKAYYNISVSPKMLENNFLKNLSNQSISLSDIYSNNSLPVCDACEFCGDVCLYAGCLKCSQKRYIKIEEAYNKSSRNVFNNIFNLFSADSSNSQSRNKNNLSQKNFTNTSYSSDAILEIQNDSLGSDLSLIKQKSNTNFESSSSPSQLEIFSKTNLLQPTNRISADKTSPDKSNKSSGMSTLLSLSPSLSLFGNNLPSYTYCQIKRHNSLLDCWITANGYVYNASTFMEKHPGGLQCILKKAGKDCTEDFFFHSKWSRDHIWKNLCIGKVIPCQGANNYAEIKKNSCFIS